MGHIYLERSCSLDHRKVRVYYDHTYSSCAISILVRSVSNSFNQSKSCIQLYNFSQPITTLYLWKNVPNLVSWGQKKTTQRFPLTFAVAVFVTLCCLCILALFVVVALFCFCFCFLWIIYRCCVFFFCTANAFFAVVLAKLMFLLLLFFFDVCSATLLLTFWRLVCL